MCCTRILTYGGRDGIMTRSYSLAFVTKHTKHNEMDYSRHFRIVFSMPSATQYTLDNSKNCPKSLYRFSKKQRKRRKWNDASKQIQVDVIDTRVIMTDLDPLRHINMLGHVEMGATVKDPSRTYGQLSFSPNLPTTDI